MTPNIMYEEIILIWILLRIELDSVVKNNLLLKIYDFGH